MSFYAMVVQSISSDPSATLSDTYSTTPRLAQLRLPPGSYFVQLTDSLTPSLPALEMSQLQVGNREVGNREVGHGEVGNREAGHGEVGRREGKCRE